MAGTVASATSLRAEDSSVRPRIGCDPSRGVKVVPDERGIYLSAYANTVGPEGGPGSAARHRGHLAHFTRAAGKRLALAYVLNPLLKGKFEFPSEQARAVWQSGAVPLISVLPISDWSLLGRYTADPLVPVQRFADGSLDKGVRRWARAASASRIPLVVVFGQEITAGGWPWDAAFNGGARTNGYGDPAWPDGAERFRDAFRRFVTVSRAVGARNITWVYWTSLPFDSAGNYPAEPKWWNRDRYHYPGDAYVDWVASGATGYFPQGGWNRWKAFAPLMDALYAQLREFAPTKPQLVEITVAYNPGKGDMARWIRDAYAQLASGRWPRIRAANWWHQRVQGSTSAIDITPGVRRAFREAVAPAVFLEQATFRCAR